MELETKIETRNCVKCGVEMQVEGVLVMGRWIFGQTHCEACVMEHNEVQERCSNPDEFSVSIIPKGMDAFDENHPDLPDAIKPFLPTLWEWDDETGVGIGIAGKSGLGKTRSMYELVRMWEEHKRWAIIPDMQLNDIIRENDNRRSQLEHSIRKADFIFWDDFGSAKMTQGVHGFYQSQLDHCQEQRKLIFVTSNYGPNQTRARWAERSGEFTFRELEGDKLMNRLQGLCKFYHIK